MDIKDKLVISILKPLSFCVMTHGYDTILDSKDEIKLMSHESYPVIFYTQGYGGKEPKAQLREDTPPPTQCN